MSWFFLVIIALLALVAFRPGFSFRNQTPGDYAAKEPSFDIRKHLNGALVSEGMIYGPRGRVTSRFIARFKGEWDGETGTLAESFQYDTGNNQERKWRLTMGEDGHFTATADDIIGTATGRQLGAAVSMRYRIRLPAEAGGHVLTVTDWLYLMENGNILNRSEMRKFGLKVAELIATIRPEE
ncbi:DUF3833 domain-containing protein [Rhodobacteraceae bacterium 63075]|nr:DUF3833 domain-containing protein [Rhodobacteraceae bacterium 63075]